MLVFRLCPPLHLQQGERIEVRGSERIQKSKRRNPHSTLSLEKGEANQRASKVSVRRTALAGRAYWCQLRHKTRHELIEAVRLINKHRVRCVFDLFETRAPDFRRSRLLAG